MGARSRLLSWRRAAMAAVLAAAAPPLAVAEGPAPYLPEAAAKRVLAKDLATLAAWLPGHYNNTEQLYFEDELEVDAALRHARADYSVTPIALPALGEQVFYVERWADDDPAKLTGQWVLAAVADPARHAVRLDRYRLKDAAAFAGASADPARLGGLAVDSVEKLAGCEIPLRRMGDQLQGVSDADACRVPAADGKAVTLNTTMAVTAERIFLEERMRDEAGADLTGGPAGVPDDLRKRRGFSCWVSVLKPGSDPNEAASWSFARDQKIHDQGGRLWLGPEQGTPVKTGLKMRNVVWPYPPNQPSLVLYVYDEANPEKAVSYSWADPKAERVGINLRWMQASCQLDKTAP